MGGSVAKPRALARAHCRQSRIAAWRCGLALRSSALSRCAARAALPPIQLRL